MRKAKPSIVTYHDDYQEAFRALNLTCLERHFEVEETDRRQLYDPYDTIIKPGGEIFFVMVGDQVQGTCALIKQDDAVYELAKMAVAPEARGQGLGTLLLETAIAWARTREATRLILVSNTILTSAIRLYQKHGFITTHRGPHPAYATANIAMKLDLSDHG